MLTPLVRLEVRRYCFYTLEIFSFLQGQRFYIKQYTYIYTYIHIHMYKQHVMYAPFCFLKYFLLVGMHIRTYVCTCRRFFKPPPPSLKQLTLLALPHLHIQSYLCRHHCCAPFSRGRYCSHQPISSRHCCGCPKFEAYSKFTRK